MISLTFPFAPVAWQRVRRDRRGTTYVPEKTRRAKSDLALWASKHVSTPFTGPIKVTARFFLARPKKLKKGSKGHPITRPDIDNYLKCIFDGLNGVAWSDDSQIIHADVKKLYAEKGTKPRIELHIEELV